MRDLLHVADLAELVDEQLLRPERWIRAPPSTSAVARRSGPLLRETTELCAQITGNRVDVGTVAEARPGDVPVYISDCGALHALTQWRPQRTPEQVLVDIDGWICENEAALRTAL